MAWWVQLKFKMPHPEGVSTANMVSFRPAIIKLWMRENVIFLVPVKYTLVCHTPTLSVLGYTTCVLIDVLWSLPTLVENSNYFCVYTCLSTKIMTVFLWATPTSLWSLLYSIIELYDTLGFYYVTGFVKMHLFHTQILTHFLNFETP